MKFLFVTNHPDHFDSWETFWARPLSESASADPPDLKYRNPNRMNYIPDNHEKKVLENQNVHRLRRLNYSDSTTGILIRVQARIQSDIKIMRDFQDPENVSMFGPSEN